MRDLGPRGSKPPRSREGHSLIELLRAGTDMRPQNIALFLIGLAMASCSADPKSAVGASLSGGVRFQHRVHERNDGKTMLIVTPVRGLVQDSTIIEREAWTYAEAFANQTCPRGYNFFGHGPPGGWKAEHTLYSGAPNETARIPLSV